MDLSNNIILVPLITGPIFMLAGIVMMFFPPRKINILYGYRTSSSMKSQDRWDFAQKYSAKALIKFGCILLLTSALGLVYHPDENTGTIIGIGLMIAVIVIMFLDVEKAIKKRFSEERG